VKHFLPPRRAEKERKRERAKERKTEKEKEKETEGGRKNGAKNGPSVPTAAADGKKKGDRERKRERRVLRLKSKWICNGNGRHKCQRHSMHNVHRSQSANRGKIGELRDGNWQLAIGNPNEERERKKERTKKLLVG
jgi:hypothetical protein